MLTSRQGHEYLPEKELKRGPERVSKAILFRHHHTGGSISTSLAIKRYKIVDRVIELVEDPKKDISLDDEELRNLLDYLAENIKPFREGLKKYFPIDLESVKLTGEEILSLLTTLPLEDVRQIMTEVKASPQLISLANSVQIQNYRATLKEFTDRLTADYPEDGGNDSWQTWFTVNHWLFGSNYKTPIPKAKISIEGSMPDYLFPTTDGYVDALDIKKPDCPEILLPDNSHTGSFHWSAEVNEAIGQMVNYIYTLDENRLKLAEMLKINIARPRGIIVAGRSSQWSPDQIRFYRKLSFSLHGIEILTYDHLCERATSLLDILSARV